jgi:hypothetical protein
MSFPQAASPEFACRFSPSAVHSKTESFRERDAPLTPAIAVCFPQSGRAPHRPEGDVPDPQSGPSELPFRLRPTCRRPLLMLIIVHER